VRSFLCLGPARPVLPHYALTALRFTYLLRSTRTPDKKESTGTLLLGLAAVVAGANRPERAATLYGAAQTLFEMVSDQTWTFDRAEFDRHIQIAREQLGGAAFEALAAEGRALTLEQAIDLAWDTTPPASH
jgi:hypothetical protein